MTSENHSLEQECEDVVFQICSTRERYSTRCAKQLEKHLESITTIKTAHVQKRAVQYFEKPQRTDEQQQLLNDFNDCLENKIQGTTYKNDLKIISSRIKELKLILNQIERSKNSELHQLLEQ